MKTKKLGSQALVTSPGSKNIILAGTNGQVSPISLEGLRSAILTSNNDLYLNQIAFYIDINEPGSSLKNVNTGGNREMYRLWKSAWRAGVMDQDGNWAALSDIDNRYFADGAAAVNVDTGEVVPELANCNFISIIPKTGCYVQTIEIAGKTIERLWLSLLPLPGWTEPEQLVGMFKANIDESGRLRSLPGKVPTGSKTNKQFWDAAQLYGKNYGTAGVFFRNFLLWYMMAEYGQRSSQECKLGDGTLVWGVGLDGTESTTASDKLAAQKSIKTGATLALGKRDGKTDVTDLNSEVCHSVKVLNFENPWGQYWEFDSHLCSFGADVYAWRENFMPTTSAPAKTDFASIKTISLTRNQENITNVQSSGQKMNIIPLQEQGVFMIPYATQAGVAYGDYYYYDQTGQLWLWGGSSPYGADCGLAASYSNAAWTHSNSHGGARLAYYGEVREVTGKDLIK